MPGINWGFHGGQLVLPSVLLNVVILIVISLKWGPKQMNNDLEGALPESGYSSTQFLVK